MTVRPYTESDLEDLLDVWYRASRVAHAFLPADFFATERRAIAEQWLPIAETVVYESEDGVVGFLSLIGNEVGAIFVDPDHQGRGLGRALMDWADDSRPWLELSVFEANSLGRGFYERYGFEYAGRRVHEATGQPELRLRLDRAGAAASGPHRDRPEMPDGYGVPETTAGVLEWAAVEQRLAESAHYWMATSRPDGRPHVVPRWGVWLDGRFWYDGSPDTVHVRNLNVNSACVLHLEDGRQAVIVEGRSEVAEPPGPEFGGRLAAEFTLKYGALGYSPEADAWEGADSGGLRVLTPHKAMAWFDFPADVTRFRF